MSTYKTILSKQEKQWISERRVTRLTDNKEVQIYPMGAERYLSSVLFGNKPDRYTIRADIEEKDVLIIPGHGTSGFLFAEANAKSITVYDKDPVTISWMKAFKKYYHYREPGEEQGTLYPSIGELLIALNRWYPSLIILPSGKYKNFLLWALNPNLLRRTYIHYLVSLARQAVLSNARGDFELDKNIKFNTGTLNTILTNKIKPVFDTAFIPYLLGVQNGIENEDEIVAFIEQLMVLVPKGPIVVSPSRSTKEFYIMGKRYLITPGYSNIKDIPGISPYVLKEDRNWLRTQGLAVFCPVKSV